MAKRRQKPRELSPTELSRMLHHAERVMESLRMFYENEFGDDTRDDGEQLDAAFVRYAKLANKLAFKIRKEGLSDRPDVRAA